jgi:hypothetical protein
VDLIWKNQASPTGYLCSLFDLFDIVFILSACVGGIEPEKEGRGDEEGMISVLRSLGQL